MTDKFVWKKFAEININDAFFNSLKDDYAEFTDWFQKKSLAGENALVFQDEQGIEAFIYLKREKNEPIELADRVLPILCRLKIGTFKLSERVQGLRLGEGAIGVSLWYWQRTKYDEIYVTVFEKHTSLVDLLCRFGFICVGKNKRGEGVYLKKRNELNYSDSYKSFPFISGNFTKAGIVPINEDFHFGKGKNIIHRVLDDNGLFKRHPYEIELTKKQFIQVLDMGGADVQNIIIN